MVKIRFARHGRKKSPFYRVVVADSRCARDGRFIEQLGYYNPLRKDFSECSLDIERMEHWIGEGAQPSDRAAALYKAMKKQNVSKKDAA